MFRLILEFLISIWNTLPFRLQLEEEYLYLSRCRMLSGAWCLVSGGWISWNYDNLSQSWSWSWDWVRQQLTWFPSKLLSLPKSHPFPFKYPEIWREIFIAFFYRLIVQQLHLVKISKIWKCDSLHTTSLHTFYALSTNLICHSPNICMSPPFKNSNCQMLTHIGLREEIK